jgi:hypothetical protein
MKKNIVFTLMIILFISFASYSYYNYFVTLKEFNTLEENTIKLESKEMYDVTIKNNDILNYVEWDKPGYQLLNSDFGKIIYIRLPEEPCQSYETYSTKIKNNTLTIKMLFRESVDICIAKSIDPLALGERFLIMKNTEFNDVEIIIKNSLLEKRELNKLLILKDKNIRDIHYDGNISKWGE